MNDKHNSGDCMNDKHDSHEVLSSREGNSLVSGSIGDDVSGNPTIDPTQAPVSTEAKQKKHDSTQTNETLSSAAPKCLHKMFEAQVERTPDAIAIIYKDKLLTYAELDESANRLAHYLQQKGVGAETHVGLLMHRSLKLVIGLLAILKAGGAYVPLDPEYPPERLRLILADAQVDLLLTEGRLGHSVAPVGMQVVSLESDDEDIATMSLDSPPAHAFPDSAAYIIYTSGSTGRPKGVVATHHNVAQLFQASEDKFHFSERDVWALFHSSAFDLSVWEIWGALLYGGRVVIVPYWESRTPDKFYKLLTDEEVTVLTQTPSAFRQLMQAEADIAGQRPSLPSLRVVIFAGEALEVQSLSEWFDRHEDTRPEMINMYGITETTVHTTYRPVRLADVNAGTGSLIGHPLPGSDLYVMDEQMRPSPVGVAGEIYVGGGGLTRGYLNRPDLTAERFVPHPFSKEPGARLYRSGDLGRWTADDDLEYLGRIDHQVKIRGFRIELGEIQSVLASHPAVKAAVVVVRTETADEKLLVAYVVPRPGRRVPLGELRGYLQERLPDYMIPATFVLLERLPLTPNGKIDRQALPAPDTARPEMDEDYVAPRNKLEAVLASIWSNVLRVERVGVHDNFFDLGGDSMRSVQVISQARERGLDFSVQQLFQKQTISMLAAEVKMLESDASEPSHSSEPFSLISADDRQKLSDEIEDAYPLAMMQAGMLYHMAYMPDQMIYHNVYSYHMRARCDVEVFSEVLQQVTQRHPILRTSFDLSSYSEPLQLVHRKVIFPLIADDISDLSADEQEKVLDVFFESEKWKRFDLSRPPLLRFHIHRRTKESFNLTMSECHPIFDGWSLHSLLAEIFTRYFALLKNGTAPEFTPISSSYADFVRLERTTLESEEYRRFWDGKLQDATAVELPRFAPTSLPQETTRIRHLQIPLTGELSQTLKQLARSLRVPLKTVLLTAHLKVMSIISGQTDILTGMVSVGRPEETDGERVLGLFFNTLPFRLKLPAGAAWIDLIRETFAAEIEILPYRNYPTAMLQKQWGHKPLFETIFNYLHFHVIDDLLASGDLEVIDASRAWEETNLTLSTAFILPPLASHVVLSLRYDTRRLYEEKVLGIGEYYLNVLKAIVADPYQAHSSQSFLTEKEQHQLLSEWNNTKTPAPRPVCVHHLFEEQAEKTPGDIAVVYEDERLTFDELNQRANQLARHLQALGVEPEVPVGIYLGRSVEMLVCILGIMKAGGAYVPLDPMYPQAGLASMLEEAGVRVVLTLQSLLTDLPEGTPKVVCIDTERETIARSSTNNPQSRVTTENLSCLFFTSGSTGRSKAVGVEHRQLINYVNAIVERLELTAGLSYALISPFTTDLGNTVILPSLVTGGSLHIISQSRLSDAHALAQYFERYPADCLKIVPSHLSALLASSPGAHILPRQRLILGGESSDWELVENINRQRPPDCVVFNHYGPTETTVGVMAYRLVSEAAANDDAATLPLGRPLGNTQVYLLDSNLHPVPTATPGEIYIGGAGLARGYVNRPDLTAETFIPHPFSDELGARLYKTGDLARYLPDGNVEFLGRNDHQVKIRGFRVELQAIEAVLREHPSVRQAVALVSEDAQRVKQLTAYVVAEHGSTPSISELRGHMKMLLPSHMSPSSFVLLDALPLTPGGKVDRQALPGMHALAQQAQDAYVAPRNAMERTIAAVWQEALQLDQVDVHDNFFDVGGHSFVMLQVQSKLHKALHRTVSIMEMFEHPTISSLAEHLAPHEEETPTFQAVHQEAESRIESLLRRRGQPSAAGGGP
jgi:amino acid adenylation domain-containing protein